MPALWTAETARHLLSTTTCPRCRGGELRDGICPRCDADLTGPLGAELWDASLAAARAIEERQAVIDRLPLARAARVPRERVVLPPADPPLATTPRTAASRSQTSVQSVLAVAGAGLVAVAAIVFTFFNPDLTNFATRTLIVAAVTLVFLGGAWLLARARLRFSAEAVGALGMVFVALDIWAVSEVSFGDLDSWASAAIATLLGGALLIGVGSLARIRTWLWSGLVAVAVSPALLGYAQLVPWSAIIGHVAVGFVALALRRVIRGLASRFASTLAAESRTSTVLQFAVVVVVPPQLLANLLSTDVTTLALPTAGVLAALAALAGLSTRFEARIVWSYAAGAFAAAAVAVLPLALPIEALWSDAPWIIAVVPVAAGVAVAALAAVRRTWTIERRVLLGGAWTVLLVVGAPAGLVAGIQVLQTFRPVVGSDLGLTAMAGLGGVALGSAALALFTRDLPRPDESRSLSTSALSVTLWIAGLALLALATWPGLVRAGQAGVAIGGALALTAVLVRVRAVSTASVARIPVLTVTHLLLVAAAAAGWAAPDLTIVVNTAVVASLIVVARTVAPAVRRAHLVVGYAYALVIFATALDRAGLEGLAVLSLTTTLAAFCALVATRARRLSAVSWYAVLAVTAIPFLLGIASVLIERSGWTALSTAAILALAATLVVTRRAGLARLVRVVAAAILVPAIAVVVICLGAEFLAVSGSPVTLPIIAAIVAATLPSTPAIGAFLTRRGLTSVQARDARIAIELSTLVTAAFAVLLALVRAAAGLETTLLVLLILGVGAAVAGIVIGRAYAWVVSAASFTGALWCVWALVGVTVLEPYVLPPALGAAVVGAALVARGRAGARLYAAGITVAATVSLASLALVGNPGGDALPWRALGLITGAFALLALGRVLGRLPESSRLRGLGAPTLGVAILAAAGASVQAVRYGWRVDAIGTLDESALMGVALGLCVAASGIAAASARLILRAGVVSRWLYVPALVLLVVGPMAAVRPEWFSVAVVWLLAVGVLGVMVATVAIGRERAATLPPVWLTFAVAWFTAVAGWSTRDLLRVEAFSLPLGLALLVVGVIALRRTVESGGPRTLSSWPHGFAGSWPLLTPGLVVTFLPSVLATATDPQILRAILVIALALAAILLGSLRRLAAPFVLGILVLPIENIVVFAVQILRGIGAAPWWITLATAGAVLLVIAVTYERGAGRGGVAARVRDLA